MKLPPGLQPHALKSIARAFAPLVAVLVLARVLQAAGLALPTLVVVVLALASIPAAYAANIVYTLKSIEKRAARAGAVLLPRWEGKRFGSLDLLDHCLSGYHNGYIGTLPPCLRLSIRLSVFIVDSYARRGWLLGQSRHRVWRFT